MLVTLAGCNMEMKMAMTMKKHLQLVLDMSAVTVPYVLERLRLL